jgi:hypothetical protein
MPEGGFYLNRRRTSAAHVTRICINGSWCDLPPHRVLDIRDGIYLDDERWWPLERGDQTRIRAVSLVHDLLEPTCEVILLISKWPRHM